MLASSLLSRNKNNLEKEQDILDKIIVLINKLKRFLLSARLLKLSPWRQITQNMTDWRSSHEMEARYIRIGRFLPTLNVQEADKQCLSLSENQRLHSLVAKLNKIERVKKPFHRESKSTGDVR